MTGNYPGKAGTPDELRSDVETALSLIPGKHRLNLHAFYRETSGKWVDRNEMTPEQHEQAVRAVAALLRWSEENRGRDDDTDLGGAR